MIRKSQSSSDIRPSDDNQLGQEETKSSFGGPKQKEAPPKDNNERVSRLLLKLENASYMNDMEELSNELRYLQEFDLHTAAYNEDQIKRTFLVS